MPAPTNMSDAIDEIKATGLPVFLSTPDIDVVFQTRIKEFKSDALVLENTVPHSYISALVGAVRYHIQAQLIRLEAENIESDGVNIVFPLANLDVKEDNREAKRVFFDQSDDVFLEVINPFDQETLIRKPIIDISNTGISIKSPIKSNLYHPGTHFKDMKILVNGELYNQTSGHVVYHRRFLDLNGKSYYQIGFRFDS